MFARQGFAGAVIALAFSGCAGPAAENERIELPGFSVELPAGRVKSTSTVPTGGKHAVELQAPSWGELLRNTERADRELEVHWSTNVMSRERWSSQLIPATVSALPLVGVEPGILEERLVADDRWLYIVGAENTPVGIGIVTCDPRFAVVVTYVRFRDRTRQAEALSLILQSVRCAVTDANRARPVAASRLPAKFGSVVNPDAQIYRSIDGEYLATTVGNSNVLRHAEALRRMIEATASAMFGTQVSHLQELQVPEPERVAILRGTIGGSSQQIYFGVRYCEASHLSLMTAWLAPHASDQLALERLSQIDCPGERSTETPEFDALVLAACKAGDLTACNLPASLP